MKKSAILIAAGFGLFGCATLPAAKGITVETEPPGAAISVDGAYVGDSPVTTNIRSSDCTWVGVMNAPGGKICKKVRIQAQPKGSLSGPLYTQEVNIDPRTMMSDKVFLNLRLEPIKPTQGIEIKTP